VGPPLITDSTPKRQVASPLWTQHAIDFPLRGSIEPNFEPVANVADDFEPCRNHDLKEKARKFLGIVWGNELHPYTQTGHFQRQVTKSPI